MKKMTINEAKKLYIMQHKEFILNKETTEQEFHYDLGLYIDYLNKDNKLTDEQVNKMMFPKLKTAKRTARMYK